MAVNNEEHKDVREAILNGAPMNRIGGEDDMKGVTVFIASDASAYTTGHVPVNDGGQLAR
jgi:gluconate 5-dehydrogenase